MNRDALAKTIYDTCHITGRFLLRSGQTSSEYFDKYLFESNPQILARLGKAMAALVPSGTEILAGLEMGGIPVATAIAFETGLPLVFVRKKAKAYGTAKIAEGIAVAGKTLLIVEDVVTTGGAILDGAAALRALGARIDHVLCVIDRESGGPAKLAEKQLTLTPLFTALQLKAATGQPD